MNKIFARSPYVDTIDEPNQFGSKLEIYLWLDGDVAPSLPQHTLSKLIPSATNTATHYNVSPYIREFISFDDFENVYNTVGNTDKYEYCWVKLKYYKFNGSNYVYITEREFLGFDGYGYYEDGANPQHTNYLLENGTHYYWYNPTADLSTDENARAGQLTFETYDATDLRYTNLITGAVITTGIPSNTLTTAYRVYPLWYGEGNLLEILDGGGTVLQSYTFRPIDECRYEPIPVDFINKYGAWQREYFFKASFEQFETTANKYNLLVDQYPFYNIPSGVSKEFNKNGRTSIRLNTGLREEAFNEAIKQMILSQRILINNLPYTPKTTGAELLKDINTKIRNYTIEFEQAYDMINNII